jgi:hypothetical protein
MSTLSVRAEQTPATTFRRSFVQDILPFLTSLLLHASLVVLGIVTYKAVVIITTVIKEPPLIPAASSFIDPDSSLNPPQFQGLNDDSTRQTEQDKFRDAPEDSAGLSDKVSAILTPTKGGSADNAADDPLALGLQTSFGKKGNGLGIGENDGTGIGAGTGLARFGIPGGGGNVDFIVHGHANKVLFLCDSSGSMLPKFDALRAELRKAIDQLKPNQRFDIIFFAQDAYVTLDPQLQYAVPENKRQAYDLLDKTAPHGTSDPIPGLRAAFATHPELIFLLTDGDFPNNDQVRQEIRKLNPGQKIVINTIAFFDRGEQYEQLLKQIADETKGAFKFVTEEELKP